MKTLEELKKLSKDELISLVLELSTKMYRMKELLNRKEASESSWTREAAQRDGGGFTDAEQLESAERAAGLRW